MTHLQWICELTKYLYYICRTTFQVILGRVQLPGSGGIVQVTTNKIVHPNYNPRTLANDIALLRIEIRHIANSEYPSQVSLMLLCVHCGHVIGVQPCGFCQS